MPTLVSLADIRDVFIIIWGTVGIIFLIILSIVVWVLGMTVRNLLGKVSGMLDDSVRPAVGSIKDAAETVRGTTQFMGKTTVTPIFRAYSTFAGVKKGLGVLSGFSRRGR